MRPGYRPEIDGLRTIAVLSVIIYHAEFLLGKLKLLPGGFFGVDIFLVISGFLITSLMLNELKETGKLSILRFYERRTRRILPALLVVMLVSMPFAWFIMDPDRLVDYAQSLVSSIFFGSNIYWNYSLQEYGAESGLLKPFLHTWSLAVEEQYYIVFPLMLLVVFRKARAATITLLLIGLLASLQFAEWMSARDASFSFYMLPSRFWELLAGAMLAALPHFHERPNSAGLISKTMPAIGLYLILYSIIFLDFESSRHPGFITLLPVIGTMLIIAFANEGELVTRLLASRLFVAIGLISYSLYLWHVPIFAVLRLEGRFDTNGWKLLAIALTFILSLLSFLYVERVFRSHKAISNRVFYSCCILVTLLVLALSGLVIWKKGFPERDPIHVATQQEKQQYKGRFGEQAYTLSENFTAERKSVELIGNSWAHDLANALTINGNYEVGYRGTTRPQCHAITSPRMPKISPEFAHWKDICATNVERFKVDLRQADLVILADDRTLLKVGNPAVLEEVRRNVQTMRTHGYKGPVMVVGNRPVYLEAVHDILRRHGALDDTANQYARQYMRFPLGELRKEDALARKAYAEMGIHYFSLVDVLCPRDLCLVVDNGRPLYYDQTHLTLTGEDFVDQAVAGWIEEVISSEPAKAP